MLRMVANLFWKKNMEEERTVAKQRNAIALNVILASACGYCSLEFYVISYKQLW